MKKSNMKLYLITTSGLGQYYLVAESPNEAQDTTEKLLEEADYGFQDARKVKKIELMAISLDTAFNDKKPFFCSGNELIIAKDWK